MALNWEELRCLVSVIENGSLTTAAKQLGISQPTVGRRIKDLQSHFATSLVVRKQDQYETTELGATIYALAAQMRDTAWAIECNMLDDVSTFNGDVTITTTDCIAVTWLGDQLEELLATFPCVHFDICTDLNLQDLVKNEADIAIRIGSNIPSELLRRRITHVNIGLYAAESYLATHGTPTTVDELTEHIFVDSIGGLADVVQVCALKDMVAGAPTSMGSDNLLAQCNSAGAGMGIVALPYYLGSQDQRLKRLLPTQFDINLDLNLLIHPNLRDIPMYRAVYNHLFSRLSTDADLFTGSRVRH